MPLNRRQTRANLIPRISPTNTDTTQDPRSSLNLNIPAPNVDSNRTAVEDNTGPLSLPPAATASGIPIQEDEQAKIGYAKHLEINEKSGHASGSRPGLMRGTEMGSADIDAEKAIYPSPNIKGENNNIIGSFANKFTGQRRSSLKKKKEPNMTEGEEKGGKSARFQQDASTSSWNVQGAWTMFRAKLRNPSHPSSSSHLESGIGEDGTSAIGSFMRPKGKRSTTGGTSVGRGSVAGYDDDDIIGSGDRGASEPVSVIAVENDLRVFIPMAKSDNGSAVNTADGRDSTAQSLGHNNPGTERSTTQPSWVARMTGGSNKRKDGIFDDGSSVRRDKRANLFKRTYAYEIIFERLFPMIAHFCDSKYPEPSKEKSYLKEVNFAIRRGAVGASLFYVLAWLMTAVLQSKPISRYGYYGYILATGIFIVPLPALVILDIIKLRPRFYQAWVWCATWGFSVIVLVDMYQCGFYSTHRNCGTKDFLGLFYWGIALPVLAAFGLGQKRSWHIFGVIVWVTLVIALILVGGSPGLMYRNFVNFILFHSFLLMISYLKEKSDRQLFSLRTQLKLQYRATQAAQISEKKANNLSRRFVSYIFHEVRVPLNTALLAVQNLENEGVYTTVDQDQRDMVDGLQASLTMMEKVLNDVLSFNRMESGKFTQSRKPLDLHKSVQLVVLSHNAQAQAGGLYLKAELDPEIDKLGGTFISDEMRIRQVMSNLVSNATKFTSSGGITVTTKLLYPRLAQFSSAIEKPEGDVLPSPAESPGPFAPYQQAYVRGTHDKAIIRVEVKDTGIGLAPKDTKKGALFSPYVQTEIGRRQGGKGTGLGLALCMQIVKLMGGRMGVDSQLGVGSTFWFELALLLPPPSNRSGNANAIPRALQDPTVHVADKAYEATPHMAGVDSLMDDTVQPRPPIQQASSSLAPLIESKTPDSQDSDASPNNDTPFSPVYETIPYQSQLKAENLFDAIEERVHTEAIQDQYRISALPALDAQYQESETSTMYRKESSASHPLRKGSEASTLAVMSGTSPKKIKTKDGKPPLRCLVVDDDTMTRKLMCRMLLKMGHSTEQAENGQLALEMLRKRHFEEVSEPQFEIVFLDNQMPVMTGVECARELRAIGCPIFICGATGNALQDDQSEYLDAGADRILTKPIKQASILEALDEGRLRVAGMTKPKGDLTDQPDEAVFQVPPPAEL